MSVGDTPGEGPW